MRFPPATRLIALATGGLAALGVAGMAARDAAGNAFARTRPALALTVDPGQSTALGRVVDDRITTAAAATGRIDLRAEQPALRAALRADPLNADLLRQYAMTRSVDGETPSSRTLMALAQRVSRRDLLTQMWMIEAAVAAGNIDRALAHYDVALTTSRRAAPLLFPVLNQAISAPEIHAGLARYLNAHRPWAEAFLAQAVANAQPRAVAALLADVPDRATASGYAAARSGLIGAFVVQKDYAGLERYVATMPARDRSSIRTLDFTSATTDERLRPLTWELTDESDIGAAFQSGEGLVVRARSGTRGIVARRILFVPAGRWRLAQTVAAGSETLGPSAQWEAYCLAPGASDPFWTQPVPRRGGRLISDIVVPAGCGAVEMRVVASADMDNANDAALTVSKVALDRVG